VDGWHGGDVDAVPLLRAADVHALTVLDALALQPATDLQDGDDLRLGALGDGYRVAGVIEMAMTDEQQIDAGDVLQIVRRGWIMLQPGVDQNDLPIRCFNLGGGMTHPRYRYAVLRNHCAAPFGTDTDAARCRMASGRLLRFYNEQQAIGWNHPSTITGTPI